MSMDARPAEMRQWRDQPVRTKVPRTTGGNRVKTDDRTPHRQRTTERAAREDWQKAPTSPEELESSRRPDRCRTTREREKTPNQTRVRTPRKG